MCHLLRGIFTLSYCMSCFDLFYQSATQKQTNKKISQAPIGGDIWQRRRIYCLLSFFLRLHVLRFSTVGLYSLRWWWWWFGLGSCLQRFLPFGVVQQILPVPPVRQHRRSPAQRQRHLRLQVGFVEQHLRLQSQLHGTSSIARVCIDPHRSRRLLKRGIHDDRRVIIATLDDSAIV